MPVTPTLNEIRPTSFSQFVGNDHVIQRLVQQIRNRSFPRLCFLHGPSGAGKTTLARILARLFFCKRRADKPEETEPCGQCKPCIKGIDTLLEYNEWKGEELTLDPKRWQYECRHLLQKSWMFFVIDETQDVSKSLQRLMRADFEDSKAPVIATTTHVAEIDDALRNRFTNNMYELRRPTTDEAADAMSAICGVLGVQFDRRHLVRIAASLHCDMRKCAEFPRTAKAQAPEGKITDAFLDLVIGPATATVPLVGPKTPNARRLRKI